MARLPTHLQIETRHVLTAIMGGEAACAKILATILVDALADAGVLPLTDLPVRPEQAPHADDGGTGAAPPRPMETISSATSNEGGKINTAPQAPDEQAAKIVMLKGEPVDARKFRRMWFGDPGVIAIAERLGCSAPTVLRIAKDFDLPVRRSSEWHAARAARAVQSAADMGPVAQLDSAPKDGAGNGAIPAEVAGSSPAGSPPPSKPTTRRRCAFIIDAGRMGTTTCLDQPEDGSVYCERHRSDVRRDRGAA